VFPAGSDTKRTTNLGVMDTEHQLFVPLRGIRAIGARCQQREELCGFVILLFGVCWVCKAFPGLCSYVSYIFTIFTVLCFFLLLFSYEIKNPKDFHPYSFSFKKQKG
jgi:hypothetical protein